MSSKAAIAKRKKRQRTIFFRRARNALLTLRGDIFGGCTAAVVALPLCIAFGVTSGLGPIAGLYGSIGVGFFAALCGGSRVQISGPTGPMAIVMAAILTQYGGNAANIFAIVMLAGAFQLVIGWAGIGRYIAYMPYSVVSGFISGIGMIILIVQFLPAIGAPAGGGPMATLSKVPDALVNLMNEPAAFSVLLLTGMTLAISVYWPRWLRGLLPAPLAGLVIGTGVVIFLQDAAGNKWLDMIRSFSGIAALMNAPTIGEVPTGLPKLYLGEILGVLTPSRIIDLMRPAVLLAVLSSIESLLTALVADSVTRTRHNSDKELRGQGIGNMFSGMIGGLPGAGATTRTVVNARAGSSTRLSGMIHSTVLLGIVLGFGELAGRIPLAVLAGILLKIGWDGIDWRYVLHIRALPRGQVIVMLTTLILTVFVDLVSAVVVGVVIATFVTAEWMEKEEVSNLNAKFLRRGRISVVSLTGSYSHASAREMVSIVSAEIELRRVLVFDLTETTHMDTSNIFAVEEIITTAVEKETECVVAVSELTAGYVEDLKFADKIGASNIKSSRAAAIRYAGEIAARRRTPTKIKLMEDA
ncbi:MAG: SulP family inorganic anion transporter [Gammaproteobacteria bacterium]|nr:SulP family inorganic anion transporter [Gammaproteobacteria bacterium]MDA7990646.1 SulP family inorganic anion transporter [Gammaproteobacteria bacterium]MDA8011233.1 SulP family inorganic anion transporter [Gammaproteobacteria bacterium]